MSKYSIEDTTLTGIGDAIRTKEGTSNPIAVTDFATKILSLSTGGAGLDTENHNFITISNAPYDRYTTEYFWTSWKDYVNSIDDIEVLVVYYNSAAYVYCRNFLADPDEYGRIPYAHMFYSSNQNKVTLYTDNLAKYCIRFDDGGFRLFFNAASDSSVSTSTGSTPGSTGIVMIARKEKA